MKKPPSSSGNSSFHLCATVEKYYIEFISSLAGVKIKYTQYSSSTYFFTLATLPL